MSKIFVSGTGTDVGKTLVSTALILHLQSKGALVGYEKPAETGCKTVKGSPFCPDVEFVKTMTQCVTALPEYYFDPPKAPYAAARESGVCISMEALCKRVDARFAELDALIIEGAGGLLVPLTAENSFADFAVALNTPMLIAAEAGLGTINHSLLTIEAAQARSIPILGIVLSCASAQDPVFVEENAKEISRISNVPVLGTLPYMPELSKEYLLRNSQKIYWPL